MNNLLNQKCVNGATTQTILEVRGGVMALFSHAQFCATWADRYYEYYNHQKFYWTTKKKDNYGNVMHLKRALSGSIERVPHTFHGKNEQLTEPEVRNEGYNPDYFWKEEVE